MKILAVANQKGGVGKSTLTVHLKYFAEAFPVAVDQKPLRILLVDLDRQGSMNVTFPSVPDSKEWLKSSELFTSVESGKTPEFISPHVALIRADEPLRYIEGDDVERIERMGQRLQRFADDFDVCFIDTPGALGLKLTAALAAADAVVCPVAVGLFEIAGLAELWNEIKTVKALHNPRLRLIGMVPSMVHTNSPDELEGLEKIRKKFGARILPHTLAYRTAVKQATLRRRPVWLGTKGAGHLKAAKEWRAACAAILTNLGSLRK